MSRIKNSINQSLRSFKSALPIMFGMLMLVSLTNVYLHDYYGSIFVGNKFFDLLAGSFAGSVSFGIPITSYIVGGELLNEGVSLLAITAFILSWTTVGIAMLPLEAKFLGWKFALTRNVINFIFSIIIAFLTVVSVNLF